MYIFGGNEKALKSNKLYSYVFGLHSFALEKPRSDLKPDGVVQHRCISYKGNLYIFGGHNGFQRINTLYEYTVSMFIVSVLFPSPFLFVASPSTLAEDIAKGISSCLDSELSTETRTFSANRALIKARFPPLLPYLSPISPSQSSSSESDSTHSSGLTSPSAAVQTLRSKILPLSDAAADALLQYISTDKLPVENLSISDVSGLLAFAEECGSIRIKTLCARVFASLDLSQLSNLGEAMVVAKKFGMVQLERFELTYLLLFSILSLLLFPSNYALLFSNI